ncbi:MAG: hypothetical protein AB7S26_23840 [Sandaracinaceae bacterium]
MHCKRCGTATELDASKTCASCTARIAAGQTMTDVYCVRCGRGPGHPHIVDVHGTCWQCRQGLKASGLPEGPSAPLRPRVPCARCGGGALVRVTHVRERTLRMLDQWREVVRPLSLTFGAPKPSTELQPLGVLEAYVCRACGFTELYAKDAASLPIGEEYGTEAFDIPGGPFR